MLVVMQYCGNMREDNCMDYGSWLIEDLREHYKDLLKERDRAEIYSERADCNREALKVMAEIQQRENNE